MERCGNCGYEIDEANPTTGYCGTCHQAYEAGKLEVIDSVEGIVFNTKQTVEGKIMDLIKLLDPNRK
jgi:hypothetical protein